MSGERELLQRVLENSWIGPGLHRDIRAELEKPEPVECGEFEVKLGMMMQFFPLLPDGKYRLLAEKIYD